MEDREYRISELNPAIKRHIKAKEKYLGRKCRKVWSATNPKGEQYLFGSFCVNHDRLIVTIGFHMLGVIGGFAPSR